ncbi:MAG TPA: hypothetical protein VMC48_01565 [Methanobacterium sp.]|nr:hypothetical protein [Methanobacterium sp.]
MNKNIFVVSSRLGLPYWWVESVAIEYLECREFAGGDEIWTFNFELVSETELVKAAESERVVVSGPLIHYPQFDRKSMLKSLEKYFMGREDDDAGEHIVEGLCSKDDFPEGVEFLEFWDPKISFSEYFQVYDEGNFWQWKVAELIPIKGETYGKWTSSEIDLTIINNMDLKLGEIRNNIIKPGEYGHSEFKHKVEDFYGQLDKIRADILSKLWKIHQKRK